MNNSHLVLESTCFNIRSVNSFFEYIKRICRKVLVSCLLLSVVFINACSDDPTDEGGIIGTGIVIQGSVTVLAGTANESIDVKSSDGQLTKVAVAVNNTFRTEFLNGSGPWVLRLPTGFNRALYGIVYSDGTHNINSFSDLILRNWFARQSIDLDSDFTSSIPFTDLPDSSEFMETAVNVANLIAPVLSSYEVNQQDILNNQIIRNGLGADAFLKNNAVIIENGLVTFVLTDPTTATQSITRSALAISSIFGDTGTAAPSMPTSLRALGSAPDEIVLVWEPATDDVAVLEYLVFRDDVLVSTTPYPVYIDSGLPTGETFTYKVIAIDVAGNLSAESASVIGSRILSTDTSPPPAPRLLTEISASSSQVQFQWVQDEIGKVVSFNVYRGRETEVLSILARVTSNLVTDINVIGNDTYCYQVSAVNANNIESERSELLCIDTNNSDPTDAVNVPLPNWIVPDVENLECSRELSSAEIQTGVTVLSDACIRVPETIEIGAQHCKCRRVW